MDCPEIREWYKNESTKEWSYYHFVYNLPYTLSDDIKNLNEEEIRKKYKYVNDIISYFDKKLSHCYFAYENPIFLSISILVASFVLFCIHWLAGLIGMVFCILYTIASARSINNRKFRDEHIIERCLKIKEVLDEEFRRRARAREKL